MRNPTKGQFWTGYPDQNTSSVANSEDIIEWSWFQHYSQDALEIS
jgi:hypothetical protein